MPGDLSGVSYPLCLRQTGISPGKLPLGRTRRREFFPPASISKAKNLSLYLQTVYLSISRVSTVIQLR